MNGSTENNQSSATLVIGIHREELGFGHKVAAMMRNSVHLVQIDEGLTHKKSSYRNGFYHSAAHREIYLQLHQQLKGKTSLVIDLHTGINETGRCADILSADIHLLYKMKTELNAIDHHPLSTPGEERLYHIIQTDKPNKGRDNKFAASHTIIPEKIWNGGDYTYTGLEIYLHESGEGTETDSKYAVELIHMLCHAFNKNCGY